ncbi:hypothetical protein V8C86DRAFT_3210342 [Haematococcus lacustris]
MDWAVKRFLRFVLKRALGKYLQSEPDLQQLDVVLGCGRLELRDVLLNCEAVNKDLAPLGWQLCAGYVGKVSAQLPLMGGGASDPLPTPLPPGPSSSQPARQQQPGPPPPLPPSSAFSWLWGGGEGAAGNTPARAAAPPDPAAAPAWGVQLQEVLLTLSPLDPQALRSQAAAAPPPGPPPRGGQQQGLGLHALAQQLRVCATDVTLRIELPLVPGSQPKPSGPTPPPSPPHPPAAACGNAQGSERAGLIGVRGAGSRTRDLSAQQEHMVAIATLRLALLELVDAGSAAAGAGVGGKQQEAGHTGSGGAAGAGRGVGEGGLGGRITATRAEEGGAGEDGWQVAKRVRVEGLQLELELGPSIKAPLNPDVQPAGSSSVSSSSSSSSSSVHPGQRGMSHEVLQGPTGGGQVTGAGAPSMIHLPPSPSPPPPPPPPAPNPPLLHGPGAGGVSLQVTWRSGPSPPAPPAAAAAAASTASITCRAGHGGGSAGSSCGNGVAAPPPRSWPPAPALPTGGAAGLTLSQAGQLQQGQGQGQGRQQMAVSVAVSVGPVAVQLAARHQPCLRALLSWVEGGGGGSSSSRGGGGGAAADSSAEGGADGERLREGSGS